AQRFCDDRIANGHVTCGRIPRAQRFIDGPADAHILDANRIARIRALAVDADAVAVVVQLLRVGRAGPNGDVLNHDIVRVDAQRPAGDRDPGIGRGLARDGHIRIADAQVRPETNDAANLEHDDPWPFLSDGPTQAAVAVICESGDGDDLCPV